MQRSTRVSLALGGGGARGYAHIGAIQVIEERGLQIVGVAGSSMGALVGGLHAAGRLPEYADWAVTLTQMQVLRMLDISRTSGGAFHIDKVFARMHELLDGVLIEDFPISYTAVATDLLARKPVWFQRGPVEAAIRASIAIPGIFAPVMLDGRVLVDGGVMDPVPVAPTASTPSDLTIAISLNGDRYRDVDEPSAPSEPDLVTEPWGERLRVGASNLLAGDVMRSLRGYFGPGPGVGAVSADADVAVSPDATTATAATATAETAETAPGDPDPGGEARPVSLSGLDVMNLSFDAMQSVVTQYRFAGYPPDIIVTVPKDACRSLDFHRAAEMIALGRTLASEALDNAGLDVEQGPTTGAPGP